MPETETPAPQRWPAWAWVTLGAAALAHFWSNRTYENLAWPDEIFQTLEQGHRLAFGYGVVPWEFRDGIRSWVLPSFFSVVMKLTAWLGPGSAGYVTGVHAVTAIASVVPVAAAIEWARRAKLAQPAIPAIVCALWFELVFFSSKALTEVFAGYAIAVAVLLTVFNREEPSAKKDWLMGAAWGLTLGLRFHLAPAALIAVAWSARRDLRAWVRMCGAAAAVLGTFGLIDWITWGTPFQSIWKNFWVNVVKNKAEFFGTSPFAEYLGSLAQVWGWGGFVLLGLALVAWRKWPVVGVIAAAILLAHCAIGHKEYRFLAPFLVVVVMSAGFGVSLLLAGKNPVVGAGGAVLLLLASYDGARRYDWRDFAPRSPNWPVTSPWTIRRGMLEAYRQLSTDEQTCGVASMGIGWAWTGGSTYLHRDVPLFEINSNEAFQQYARMFNTIVGPDRGGDMGPYARTQCWEHWCVYRRAGACEATGGYSMNEWLRQNNM